MYRNVNIYRALAALAGLVLLLAIVAFPLQVSAEGEGPSSPEPVQPPPITGINTRVTLSEGDKGEIDPSGMLTSLDLDIPLLAEPPPYVEVVPQELEGKPTLYSSLSVPQRYQDPADVTCGAAALGMALDFEELGGNGGPAPSTAALVADLRNAGLLYEAGTGVEELAYVARKHGYRGTYGFHDWGLEKLQLELGQGHPVVVALGANGQGKPGHFVTVTGISDDGQWVSYNDPTLGSRTVPTAEFLRQWGMQGNSGLVVREAPLPAAVDPMLPWMGLFGALSMMAVLVGKKSARKDLRDTFYALREKLSDPRRKGLGGRLGVGSPAGSASRGPLFGYKVVQQGVKRVEKEVPVYETKQVKTGYKVVTKRVPNYVAKKIQVGMKRVTRRVPRVVDKKVQVGTKRVEEDVKVTRYRTQTYYDWKKETKQVPVYRMRKYVKYYKHKRIKDWKLVRKNGRLTLQPTYRWKRVPVYGKRKVRVRWKTKTEMKRVKRTRMVPYTTVETRVKKVPVFETRRVQDGYRTVNEIVPVYDFRTFQEGWKTVHKHVPVYEERRVQVGTETITEEVPNYEFVKVQTGGKETPPIPTTPTPTPMPIPLPTPGPYATPYPFNPSSYSPTLDDGIPVMSKFVKWTKKLKGIWNTTGLAFKSLPSGHYSVSAPGIPPGKKLAFRQSQGYAGTRYNLGTLANTTAKSLIKKATKGLGFSLGLSVGVNLYDYGIGKHSDKGIKSNEFAASTAVDFAQAGLTGLTAAGFVAGGITVAGILGFTGVVTAPLWAAALVTVGVGGLINAVVNKVWDMEKVKQDVANGFKTFPGIWENGKKIVSAGVKESKKKIGNAVSNISTSVSKKVQNVSQTVSNTVQDTKNSVKGFFGSLFGGSG